MMKNFKGFDGWIEIFRGGKQIDSRGREHDGDAMIDRAVETFDPSYHEPPVVVGHPRDNAPAFGWVQGLKKSGNMLMAKFKDIVQEFDAVARQGLYKKRSASFYPDGRLRHVGFLGAAPPAVKGLADLKFNENDNALLFEFYDPGMGTVARIFRSLRDWLIEKEGKETADAIIPDWDVEYIKDEANKEETNIDSVPAFSGAQANDKEGAMKFSEFMEIFKFWKKVEEDPDAQIPDILKSKTASPQAAFTEADIEAAKTEAAEAERKKVEAEFAENNRTAQREAHNNEISHFCDDLIEKKKIPPFWKNAGLVDFMKSLDGSSEITFAENTEKKTPLEWFKNFLEGFGENPIFREMATKDAAKDAIAFAEAKKDQDLGESIAAKVNPKS